MATIYRFIIEQKAAQSGGRKSSAESSGISKKSTAKKGKWVSIIGGEKGGVEHNRKLRAINPLLNRITGGNWEKGMRLGRAGLGLVQKKTENGQTSYRLNPVSISIIVAFIIQAIIRLQQFEIQRADKLNAQNYKMLENSINLSYYCILGLKKTFFQFVKEPHLKAPFVFLLFRLR